MMRTRRVSIVTVLLWGWFALLFCCLAGCGRHEQQQDLVQYVRSVQKQAIADGAAGLPQLEVFGAKAYTASEQISPFKERMPASLSERGGGGKQTTLGPAGPAFPLDYPLDSLKFVGTLNINGHLEAIILTPDGIYHRVRVGASIGQDRGTIMRIAYDRVEVRLPPQGQEKRQMQELPLSQPAT